MDYLQELFEANKEDGAVDVGFTKARSPDELAEVIISEINRKYDWMNGFDFTLFVSSYFDFEELNETVEALRSLLKDVVDDGVHPSVSLFKIFVRRWTNKIANLIHKK